MDFIYIYIYIYLVGLLGWVIIPVAWPLPAHDKTDTEDTPTDIHALSWIRTYDLCD
jgi:hypothetical protein